jgi:hypothetical protein
VDRAPLRDLGKALPLCFIEVTLYVNIACNLFNKSPVGNIAIRTIVSMNT